VLSQDIQACRSGQEHSDFVASMIPVRKSEIRIMPKICQKKLNLWISGWHSITNINEIPWEVTLQIVASRPIIRQKKKKLPLFSNPTLQNRTIFMIWIYKTDELHSIELAL
jgi:hypothetical protein